MVSGISIFFGGKQHWKYHGFDGDLMLIGEEFYTHRESVNCFGLETLSDEEVSKMLDEWQKFMQDTKYQVIEDEVIV